MNAAVDDQQLTERSVIRAGASERHAQAVMQTDRIVLDIPGLRNAIDQHVQRIGNDLPKPAEKIAGLRFCERAIVTHVVTL